MTNVKLRCPSCDQAVEVPIETITVYMRGPGESEYEMTCPRPGCMKTGRAPATPRAVEILRRVGGARFVEWGPQSDAPPISHDELLDFHVALEESSDGDIIRELLGQD